MIAVTTATNEIPKLYEPGWDWWAWPIAWAALALAGLILAAALPLITRTAERLEGTAWRTPGIAAASLLAVAAAVAGYMGSGVLMRHMDSGEGAFSIFLGTLLVGLLSWGAAAHIAPQPYTYSPWRPWLLALPMIVIGSGAIANGISEALTRLAASIPMPVASLGSMVLFGMIAFTAYMTTQARR
ncbi:MULTISPECIES: hypothetical protein [Paenarthrobacter]|uniref:DUF1109 domain-containing protein n=1 Tax=Paenarthrobacter ureafaciens TaxID=37931 RepID=A0AAX3EQ94_PAEUR|nr:MULTISPECIES: hypothetical protein [Paenarthrobacter]MDO5867062.1 hypothetical protein [Paenarthrobacter sp. SD-2]MDO5878230.1 hypothetical protein [Paenarthrobacter sp. SD-1]UYV95552.1 hypothetical protein NL395_23035 [Paenarthrobacter ureafaciens]UYW00152.1 hypothetical protein NL394_23420 [Paenarthrobacter ureafaciens]